jgi:hypothetical protein
MLGTLGASYSFASKEWSHRRKKGKCWGIFWFVGFQKHGDRKNILKNKKFGWYLHRGVILHYAKNA